MENNIDSLKKNIKQGLQQAAIAYFLIGIEIFHKTKDSSWENFQPAIGNLCISIELFLKSVVAANSIRDLYKNLPLEAQLFLADTLLIPDATVFRKYAIDLKSFVYKTIEFDECVSLFYIFYPNLKQKYRPYFTFLSKVRNVSVHASIPSFQKYDNYRIAYIAIELFNFIIQDKVLLSYIYKFKDKNDKFLKEYDNERIERVHNVIENAKKSSKKLDHYGFVNFPDEWEMLPFQCPVCESDGLLFGYTEVNGEGAQDWGDVTLDFIADSFECEQCGLKLLDFKELELAGLDYRYDRSSEIDKWAHENYPDY